MGPVPGALHPEPKEGVCSAGRVPSENVLALSAPATAAEAAVRPPLKACAALHVPVTSRSPACWRREATRLRSSWSGWLLEASLGKSELAGAETVGAAREEMADGVPVRVTGMVSE